MKVNCGEEKNIELGKSNVENKVKNEEVNLNEGPNTMVEDVMDDEVNENDGPWCWKILWVKT